MQIMQPVGPMAESLSSKHQERLYGVAAVCESRADLFHGTSLLAAGRTPPQT